MSFPREARLALLVAACLLAVATLVAQGIFLQEDIPIFSWRGQFVGGDRWVQGKEVAVAPVLVIGTAVAALVAATAMLFGRWVLPGLRARSLLDVVGTSVQPHWVAAVEAGLAACVLCLWAASVVASAKTADIIRSYDDDDWTRRSAAILALECAGVLVWAAVALVNADPLARAARGPACLRPGSGSAYRRLDAGKSYKDPSPGPGGLDPATSAAHTAAASGGAWAAVRACLYCVGLLLGVGVLVAECSLVYHWARLDSLGDDSDVYLVIEGAKVATAPTMVIVTATLALALPCVRLLAAIAQVVWPATACVAVGLAVVDAQTAGVLWALWVACVGASAKTAHTLRKEPYRQDRVWRESNTAVLVMECISVVVWGGALVLLVAKLVRVVRAARLQQAAAADGVEDQSAAGDCARQPASAPGAF